MATERIVVIGTHNRDKGREMMACLDGLGLRFAGLWNWPGAGPVPETGETLAENAVLKAEAAAALSGQWAVADDTGLEVEELQGAPGVRSARYAGPEATYADNRARLLAALDGVPEERRHARFRTVIALARPEEPTVTVEGSVRGTILTEERGSGGFGYDAVFYYPPAGKTFAEMTAEEKNAVSHRGQALAALRARISGLLAG